MTGKCPPVLPVWSLRCSPSIMIDTLLIIALCIWYFPAGRISPPVFWTHCELFCIHAVSIWSILSPSLQYVHCVSRPRSNMSPSWLSLKKSLYSKRVTVYNNIISTHSLDLARIIPLGLCPVIGLHCYFLGDCLTFYRFALSPQLPMRAKTMLRVEHCAIYNRHSIPDVLMRAAWGLSGVWDSVISVIFSRTWKVLTEGC